MDPADGRGCVGDPFEGRARSRGELHIRHTPGDEGLKQAIGGRPGFNAFEMPTTPGLDIQAGKFASV